MFTWRGPAADRMPSKSMTMQVAWGSRTSYLRPAAFLLVQATIHPPSKTQGTSHAPTSHQKHLINSVNASSLSASSRKLQHVLTHTSLSSGRALEDVRAILESVWVAGASEGPFALENPSGLRFSVFPFDEVLRPRPVRSQVQI